MNKRKAVESDNITVEDARPSSKIFLSKVPPIPHCIGAYRTKSARLRSPFSPHHQQANSATKPSNPVKVLLDSSVRRSYPFVALLAGTTASCITPLASSVLRRGANHSVLRCDMFRQLKAFEEKLEASSSGRKAKDGAANLGRSLPTTATSTCKGSRKVPLHGKRWRTMSAPSASEGEHKTN